MNTRSIQFRLVCWYTVLAIILSAGFGAYTYRSLRHHLYEEMGDRLVRRGQQIAANIIDDRPEQDLPAIAAQIEQIYSPDANDRFIRIRRGDATIYQSAMPSGRLFDPAAVPLPVAGLKHRIVRLPEHIDLFRVVLPATIAGQPGTIELGAPLDEVTEPLRGLLVALLLGLPIAIVIMTAGGLWLVQRALRPVEQVRRTAASITFGNLSNRLPVLPTGDALENLSRTLNQMLERLETAYQQASRFSADASHELRTPLTIMRAELESLVGDASIPEIIRERAGSVLEEAERLSRITESLFAISRLDAGEAKIADATVDLCDVVESTVDQMSLLADDRQQEITVTLKRPVKILADPTRVRQIVVNLVDNAIKYTQPHGNITVLVEAAGGTAILEVADDGVGIPAAALPKVFDRFYRVENEVKSQREGAGLGLSIVRSICQAHGGTITISSEEGSGTRVRVMLPLTHEASDEA